MNPSDGGVEVGLGDEIRRADGYRDYLCVRRKRAVCLHQLLVALGQHAKFLLEALLLHDDALPALIGSMS